MIIRDANVYVTNASAMWRALAPDARDHGDHLRVDRPTVTRIVLTRPAPPEVVRALLDSAPVGHAIIVEDVFGPEIGAPTARVLRMPVMVRPADGPAPAPPADVRVEQVDDDDDLAAAERVIVDGFPLPAYQPLVRAQALPPRVLGLPGWRVWLTRHEGQPAAAGYTYDDGAAVGLYWLVTAPEHRSRGLARAILTTAMAAHPRRALTLVATDAGVPLYESLGFRAVTTATWYLR